MCVVVVAFVLLVYMFFLFFHTRSNLLEQVMWTRKALRAPYGANTKNKTL